MTRTLIVGVVALALGCASPTSVSGEPCSSEAQLHTIRLVQMSHQQAPWLAQAQEIKSYCAREPHMAEDARLREEFRARVAERCTVLTYDRLDQEGWYLNAALCEKDCVALLWAINATTGEVINIEWHFPPGCMEKPGTPSDISS